LVTKKLVGKRPIPGLSIPGRLSTIIDSLFPKKPEITWPTVEGHNSFTEVTCEEIRELCKKIPSGKAPGPDGVPDIIIREVANMRPEILQYTFNSLLRNSLFPVP